MRSRRKFLKQISLLSGGVFLFNCNNDAKSSLKPSMDSSRKRRVDTPGATFSKVVVVRSREVFNKNGEINYSVVNKMVETGIRKLAGNESLRETWRKYYEPGAVVGIKTNCLAGKQMSTRISLVHAVAEGLQSAGVQKKDILVWERTSRELKKAGFKINHKLNQVRCFGTDEVGYESELTSFGKVCSLLSKIVTRHCDLLLNLPVLKDHNLAGLSGGMKNYYGAIHNPNKYHDDNCSPFVADVNCINPIREKNKLTIVDAIKVQGNGGPAYYPGWVVNYGGIIMGTDPVAVDVVALEVLEQIRKKLNVPALKEEKRYPVYLKIASDQQHELGIANKNKIKKLVYDISS